MNTTIVLYLLLVFIDVINLSWKRPNIKLKMEEITEETYSNGKRKQFKTYWLWLINS